MKNSYLAALLNVIPGLGYLYVGTRRLFGVLLLIWTILSTVSMFDPLLNDYINSSWRMWDTVAALGYMSLLIGLTYDAYSESERLNLALKK